MAAGAATPYFMHQLGQHLGARDHRDIFPPRLDNFGLENLTAVESRPTARQRFHSRWPRKISAPRERALSLAEELEPETE